MISLLNERVAALNALEQQIASNAQPQASTAASESGSDSATTTISVSTTADDQDFFA